MEDSLELLFEALGLTNLSWEDAQQIAAPLTTLPEMALLDMAEWTALHPEASEQELLKQMHKYLKKYQK